MGNEHLLRSAQQRSEQARLRARAAIEELVEQGNRVNFAAVAKRAGVSRDFLYRQEELNSVISNLRDKGGTRQSETYESTEGTVVKVLSMRLRALKKQHVEETDQLRKELADAQGQIVELLSQLSERNASKMPGER
ncbi:hypothetical protein I6H48_03455 [Corynebacterium amycolatum]|uniref:Transposase n=1 Tax=Corynebacterium amycolatum TaxID=43765 RepID=A0AB37GJM0_CORAY|nr:DUF6262 family protein [Corynebacterium amycolatum]QPR31413.1 hypothetical protein I6G95_02870 [Corynebacterium amycolatum]QQB83293.1 hypothetical protein I6H48_03455 [Corynebacterium amycolatum]QQV00860.1 hypothetical protein I6I64_05170 [Corynebacterium amycolatum]